MNNILKIAKVISTTNSSMMWLISNEISNVTIFNDIMMFACTRRNKHDKYIIKTSLAFICENKKELEMLARAGVSDIIATDVINPDIQVSPALALACERFSVWVDIKFNTCEKLYNLKVPKVFRGVSFVFDDNNVWDIIANKIMFNLETRLFVYGVSAPDVRRKLFNWVDYLGGSANVNGVSYHGCDKI
ncbi:hypothetical protein DXM49_24760 [Salmonella enterica]|nr:hypothetical protein [Salmonella enterica]EEB7791989.1 hypothetical protein [Salmonella enterica]EHW8722990.1 hypothetical protein [Salmonella enterica subsp. enterica serovar Mikawasima]